MEDLKLIELKLSFNQKLISIKSSHINDLVNLVTKEVSLQLALDRNAKELNILIAEREHLMAEYEEANIDLCFPKKVA